MLILGSCLALNLNYSGCCVWLQSPTCSNSGCYCDQDCHIFNDCCSDIADIGCHPASFYSPIVSPTPSDTLGKKKIRKTCNTLVTVLKLFLIHKQCIICYILSCACTILYRIWIWLKTLPKA